VADSGYFKVGYNMIVLLLQQRLGRRVCSCSGTANKRLRTSVGVPNDAKKIDADPYVSEHRAGALVFSVTPVNEVRIDI
jgi:hypothetical protein